MMQSQMQKEMQQQKKEMEKQYKQREEEVKKQEREITLLRTKLQEKEKEMSMGLVVSPSKPIETTHKPSLFEATSSQGVPAQSLLRLDRDRHGRQRSSWQTQPHPPVLPGHPQPPYHMQVPPHHMQAQQTQMHPSSPFLNSIVPPVQGGFSHPASVKNEFVESQIASLKQHVNTYVENETYKISVAHQFSTLQQQVASLQQQHNGMPQYGMLQYGMPQYVTPQSFPMQHPHHTQPHQMMQPSPMQYGYGSHMVKQEHQQQQLGVTLSGSVSPELQNNALYDLLPKEEMPPLRQE